MERHKAYGSTWCSFLDTSSMDLICDQWQYIPQWWQINTSQHLSCRSHLSKIYSAMGQKKVPPFSVQTSTYPTVITVLSWVFLLMLCSCFVKQSTADKEGEQALLRRNTNHVQIVTTYSSSCIQLQQSTELLHQSQWKLQHKVQGFAEGHAINMWPSRESSVSPHSGDLMRGLASSWSV